MSGIPHIVTLSSTTIAQPSIKLIGILYSYTTATSALPDINALAFGPNGPQARASIQAEHECTLYNCYVPLT